VNELGRAGYAGPVSRSIAYVLDAVTVALMVTGAVAVTTLLVAVIGPGAGGHGLAVASVYLVGLPSLLAVYMALFWALAGRTPGMALLGLRVVGLDGGAIGWLRALIRAAVLAYFPIGAVWLLVDRRHQAVHDKLARTTVVRRPAPVPIAAPGGLARFS
jgi:uncharacterized RDD family membrane protein YckC